MLSITQYQANIQKYNILKAKLNSIISQLESPVNHLSNLKLNISCNYKINDDDAAIISKIITLKKNITNTSKYLSGSVVPAIDRAISSCNSNINYLVEEQRRQEEERRRQEEEQRRQEEERQRLEAERSKSNNRILR